MNEKINAADSVASAMSAGHAVNEGAHAEGRYHFTLHEYEGGPLIREWDQDNIVCTLGKNLALDSFLAGSAYTVTGPFLGLISSVSYSAVAAADTMSSHAGWLEAGIAHAPTYSGGRGTAVWSSAAAGAKALSAALSYTFTGTGTVQGAFLAFGTGAVATVDNTSGTLYSAGVFGTPQPVINGNVISVTYTASM